MKTFFTLLLVLIVCASGMAQVDIPLTNADMEDMTAMSVDKDGNWVIKGFFLEELNPGINFQSNASGLDPAKGIEGSQALKAVVTQANADSNKANQVVYLNTDSIDISGRELGRYFFKVNIKPNNVLKGARPFAFRVVAKDENGVDVTATTTLSDTDEQKVQNENSDFKIDTKIADFQPMTGVFDVFANTGGGLNAKYIRFKLQFGKKLNDTELNTTYWFDNVSLTGPDGSVGIEDRNSGLNIQVYPNPAHDYTLVSCSDGIENITVYNVTGAMLRTVPVNSNTHKMDISDLSSGLYIIAVKSSKGTMNAKIHKY